VVENRTTNKLKTDMLRSIAKQSRESVESILKKKWKATVIIIIIMYSFI